MYDEKPYGGAPTSVFLDPGKGPILLDPGKGRMLLDPWKEKKRAPVEGGEGKRREGCAGRRKAEVKWWSVSEGRWAGCIAHVVLN